MSILLTTIYDIISDDDHIFVIMIKMCVLDMNIFFFFQFQARNPTLCVRISNAGMDKWTIEKCEASSCSQCNSISTVNCLLFKPTLLLNYDHSTKAHQFSTSFAIPCCIHMGRLQVPSHGNASKAQWYQSIQGMAS